MEPTQKKTAASSDSSATLRIEPVSNAKQLKEFITLSQRLYRDDPQWVAPLLFEQKQRFSPGKNPFFEHARWQAWLAYRDGIPVGRISAQIDQLYLDQQSNSTGYFGLIEAENDPAIFNILFNTAETWLREQGMQHVCGPFNLSSNEECGVLVDGFSTAPYLMMGHALPYYDASIAAAGYRPGKDLLAYKVRPDFVAPKVMLRLAEKAAATVRVRSLRRQHIAEDLEIIRDIFNDAWSQNWGFVPFTQAEMADSGGLLTRLADDDFLQIAEIEGRPVAMIFAMPNINEVIRDLNGRLLPFGWLKLLWRLKVSYPKSARIALMGVRKEYQQQRLSATLIFLLIDAVRKGLIRKGITEVELSWILEDNTGTINFAESIGGEAYKRYRLYVKDL